MRQVREWLTRLGGLFNKRHKDLELDEEIESHLQMHIDDNLQRGMTPEEARRQAMIKLGGIESTKEAYRDQRGLPSLETLWQDVRYGARMLRKNPGFATVAVLVLALGIGANTAIFSVVNAVLLRPLPYSQPDRLVFLYNAAPGLGAARLGLMEAEFLRLRDQAQSFEQVSLYTSTTLTLTGVAEPERIACGMAAGNLFTTLGVPLALGRGFERNEEPRGQDGAVILSYRFWQQKFSGNPGVLGQTLTLDERSYTVIGVLPKSFRSPLELQSNQVIDLWLPPGYNPASPCCSHHLSVVARLREGHTFEQAKAETHAIMAGVKRDYPQGFPKTGGKETVLKPLREEIVGDTSRALWILLGAVLFVLLIACANVANLLLARSEARQKEIAIRAALGAGRARIIRQLAGESLLLATMGGGLGLLLAWWAGSGLIPALGAGSMPQLREIPHDARVLGFASAVSVLTALLFGLAPVLHAIKADLHTALKEGGRTSSATSGRSRLRHGLIVTEVALSLMLLVGAGLLIRSFWQLRNVDTGFKAERLLTMRLFPPASTYPDNQRIAALYENLIKQVRTLPGITEAAVTEAVPLGDGRGGTMLQVEGKPAEATALNSASWCVVASEYFHTLGMRLVRGRFLAPEDREETMPVAVVNETLAHAHWPNENPLGRRIRLLNAPAAQASTVFLTVVGVVADVKSTSLTQTPGQEVYVPMRQRPAAIGQMGSPRQMSLVVRTAGEPMNLANAIRQTVWGIDRNIPITNVREMEQILTTVTGQPRFNMILLGTFAALALMLAAIGLYGVIAYNVSQRTREIGIRMSLGATRGNVLGLVLREGMRLVGIGLLLGIIGSLALTRALSNLLYEVKPTDPATFLSVSFLLVLVALFGCWLPARRAAKVNPTVALRYE